MTLDQRRPGGIDSQAAHLRQRDVLAGGVPAAGRRRGVRSREPPARSVGSQQLQPNAVKTGLPGQERGADRQGGFRSDQGGQALQDRGPATGCATVPLTGGELGIRSPGNGTIGTDDLADDAVTGAKVKESTLGTVPDASKFAGHGPDAYVGRGELLWAAVDENGDLAGGSGAVSATRLGTGTFRVGFNRPVNGCVSEGTATDISGGAAPSCGGRPNRRHRQPRAGRYLDRRRHPRPTPKATSRTRSAVTASS